MSTTGLPVFDTTVQKTNTWIHDVMEELDWSSRKKAYSALRAVLHTLRDHLPIQEIAQLGAQLPMLMRGFYYEGWRPTPKPLRSSAPKFLAIVKEHFPNDPAVDAEKVVRAVFSVLATNIPGGEIEDVMNVLPKSIRQFWHEFYLEPLSEPAS